MRTLNLIYAVEASTYFFEVPLYETLIDFGFATGAYAASRGVVQDLPGTAAMPAWPFTAPSFGGKE